MRNALRRDSGHSGHDIPRDRPPHHSFHFASHENSGSTSPSRTPLVASPAKSKSNSLSLTVLLQRFRSSILHQPLNSPVDGLESFFETYPATEKLAVYEDKAYFLATAQQPLQEPIPFIPFLDVMPTSNSGSKGKLYDLMAYVTQG